MGIKEKVKTIIASKLFFLLLTLIFSGSIYAQSYPPIALEDTLKIDKKNPNLYKYQYFSTYHPTYFGGSINDGEPPHFEFMISLKYPNLKPKKPSCWLIGNPFGSYTGLFDFHAGTRKSDPIVSRLQNIGLHSEWPMKFYNTGQNLFGNNNLDLVSFTLTIAHESNGQSVEDTTEYKRLREHQDPEIARNAGDYVSVLTHYVELSFKFRYMDLLNFLDNDRITAYLQFRPNFLMWNLEEENRYLSSEPHDFKVSLNQYKRYNLILSYEWDIGSDTKSLTFITNGYAFEGKIIFGPLWLEVPIGIAFGTDNAQEISTHMYESWYASLFVNIDGSIFDY